MSPAPLASSDAALAARIARTAAERLLTIRAENEQLTGKQLGQLGDRGAHETIAAMLAEHTPDDAVLSEEAADSAARLTAKRVWIIDPLDGTREYSEGRDDWAVHIGLVENGQLTLGAVALGGPKRVLVSPSARLAARGEGDAIRIAVSRTRPPALVDEIAPELGAQLVPIGSAGVKICSIVTGETDAYIHGGGQYEWDSAAPVAIARAAGLHATRLDGSVLEYNQPNPYLPDLVVCRPEVADRVMSAIEGANATGRTA